LKGFYFRIINKPPEYAQYAQTMMNKYKKQKVHFQGLHTIEWDVILVGWFFWKIIVSGTVFFCQKCIWKWC